MMRYEYIDHVLASYFAADIGASDAEAIQLLRRHLAASPTLEANLQDEVRRALNDPSFSWREVLAAHDVLTVENEAEAKSYVEDLFGAALTKDPGG
jgi:hypothetical protein